MLKDSRYQFWNGNYAYLNVVLGKGAFRPVTDFKDNDDSLGFKAGSSGYWVTSAPVDYKGTEDLLNQPYGNTDPAVLREIPQDRLPESLDEYAYGFWYRFT